MSLSTVEIRIASANPSLVELQATGSPAIVQINMGPAGAAGAAGASGGSTNAWKYKAKTTATSGYPGNGFLLWNNATQTSATSIIVSHLTDDDTDIELFLSFFVLNQKIFIQNRDDSSQNQVWRITGTPTVTGANTSTAYYTFPVTLVSSAGAAFTNNHSILFGQIVVATNAVTSATTSDGTATLSTSTLTTGTLTVSTSGVFNATSYTFGTGAAAAMKTALAIASADITDATVDGFSNPGKLLKTDDSSGSVTVSQLGILNAVGSATLRITNLTDDYDFQLPDQAGTFALTSDITVTPTNTVTLTNKTLTSPAINSATFGTAATFNATTYTYGTGAASAHKAALELFTLLTLQESDAGSFAANGGTAAGSSDGDSLNLTTANVNLRPNVSRFRNWSRNPGNSGAANFVIPVSLASAGNIIHSGTAANGASFRCGIGMVNGVSAVAANANATTGRGFGWRIAWNASTSKLEFNLWAHDGTTYVEGTGIDTGLGAANLDGFFNVIVRLASDGTVTANTWFGNNVALSVPSLTPTATLAGGPTSGTFANLGIPLWLAATHSTVAPSVVQSIIAKIINRKLYIG